MTIDLNTGLPALPENHYWMIEDMSKSPAPDKFVTDGEMVICIMETISSLGYRRERVERKGTWRDLWIPYSEEVSVKCTLRQEIIRQRTLLADHLVSSRKMFYRDRMNGWVQSRRNSLDTDEITWCDGDGTVLMVKLWETNEKNILKGAEMALKSFAKNHSERLKKETEVKLRDSFVGKYPPKVLKSEPAPVPTSAPVSDAVVSKAALKRQIAARKKKLKDLQDKYASNRYSGHPEEMLGDIDNEEYQIKKLQEKLRDL